MTYNKKMAVDIATWMVNKIAKDGELFHSETVEYIKAVGGADLLYVSENGNAGIKNELRSIFRKLHNGTVNWNRGSLNWASNTYNGPDGTAYEDTFTPLDESDITNLLQDTESSVLELLKQNEVELNKMLEATQGDLSNLNDTDYLSPIGE